MILFLQILSVTVPAAAIVLYSLLILGVTVGSVIHGLNFKLSVWHGGIIALASALLAFELISYGWWTP